MSTLLALYEPLDVIGNGSFGIIRKVKRKSDGVVSPNKFTNLSLPSSRDSSANLDIRQEGTVLRTHVGPRQEANCRRSVSALIVALRHPRVHQHLQFIRNILKDLQHEHIVRYHDRFVDRDAGVLYILMEYCGGGDLSSVIKQSQRQNKTIPEELIWNYFMQILLALSYCHHPNGHSRSGSSSTGTDTEGGKDKRPQILHRDLKPDNGQASPLQPASIRVADSQQCSWTRTTESNSVTSAFLRPLPRLALRKHTLECVRIKSRGRKVLTVIFPDTLLHVSRAHAGEGIRFKIRHLVPWLPDI